MSDYDVIKRKIMLIGHPSVGKTSLVRKFVLDVFSEKYMSTIGYKVLGKSLFYPGDNGNRDIELKLLIWDLMGQHQCSFTPEIAYKSSKGAFIVCDLTRKDTLLNLADLTNSLLKISPGIQFVFVGNKHDLKEHVQFYEKELADVATAFHVPYFLTSAKTGENVEMAFKVLGRMILVAQNA